MRVFYINLDRAPDRRAHMDEALRGVDFERIAAVDALNRPRTNAGLTRFQIACIESHRKAWQRFLATPESHACFLEDDVHLSDDFPALLRESAWIPSDAHAVKIDTCFNKVMLGEDLRALHDRRLARLFTRHESCAAYLLSRRGAEFFLAATERPDLPVDYIVFPEDPVKQGLKLYQLAPAAAIQDSLHLRHYGQGRNFASAIHKLDREKPKRKSRKLMFLFKRETLRLYRQAFRARRHLANRWIRGLKSEIVTFR